MDITLWAKRLLIGTSGLVLTALLTGGVYERIARHHAANNFPPAGKLVDIGNGRRIQLDCRGSGSPTVVLESGLDNYGSLAWGAVHDSIAATTRVCAYSRPGIMWSDPAAGPFNPTARARDLHSALINAGESAPWIMVGHSLGGPYAMVFTGIYDREVAGAVLVDPTHPDQFPRFREVAGKDMMPTPGVVKIGAALAWTGLVRLLPAEFPDNAPLAVTQIAPAFFSTSLSELAKEVEAIPATLDAERALMSLGERPFIVLTAGEPQPAAALKAMGITREQGERLRLVSTVLHEEQSRESTRGRHEVVSGASHYIQFDRPEIVIRAIRTVIHESRGDMAAK